MKKDIGILGATGFVGKGVLSALGKKGYTLLIGARNVQQMECIKKQLCSDIEIMRIDVFDPVQLETFCSRCDAIINCTSPASVVGTRVIRECVKQGIDYIDPYGEDSVEKYATENHKIIRDKGSRIILAAGTYPGLSEVLFRYVAEKYKGNMLSIKEYFYGNGAFSHGATQDVIYSMLQDDYKSMSYVMDGEIAPYKMKFGESININRAIGSVYPYPIIGKEFYKTCKKAKVREGYFFNTFDDIDSMATFFEIGSQVYFSESESDQLKKLEELYSKDCPENEKTIFLFCVEVINKNGREQRKDLFEYAYNWNILSGYVCALATEWCKRNRVPHGYICKLDEIEDVQMFVDSLPRGI